DGLANQRSFGVQENLAGPRRTVIDGNSLSSDGTVSIAGAFPDRRGTRVAYLLSEAGSDKQTLRVRDVDTGRDLPQRLAWCKHTSVAWALHGRRFFHPRLPGEKDPAGWGPPQPCSLPASTRRPGERARHLPPARASQRLPARSGVLRRAAAEDHRLDRQQREGGILR